MITELPESDLKSTLGIDRGTMRKIIFFIVILCFAGIAIAGFKAKIVKPKEPERFESRVAVSGIGFAADLLLDGREQKEFFCRELVPHDVIAVRLAVFNDSTNELVLPLEEIRLTDPNGRDVPLVEAQAVAKAVIEGIKKNSKADQPKVAVSEKPYRRIPQAGGTDPTNDPRRDPTDPNYDPRLDPSNPNHDPNCHPNSPCDKMSRRSRLLPAPGVHVDVNPYGSEFGTLSEKLIEKNSGDKAHSADPILPSTVRDKFLFFALPNRPAGVKGFELHLPQGNGIPQPITLKF
ncbi:MAG: hypothetical protein JXA73_24020 [Acidobacteria bacterium]|nr:hypothetical protein [Acidobacteriota bacterium]